MSFFAKELGPSDAATLVLLHGGGAGGWMWQPQIERLTDYHLLIPDLPEHRNSSGVKPFTFQDAAARVADLICTKAQGGCAHVVGLSLGAQTLVQLLSQSPEVVDQAIVSGALTRPLPGMSLIRLMAQMYWPFRNAAWLIRLNMRQLGIPDRFFDEVRADTRTLTLDAFVHITTANATFRTPSNLSRVNVPTLVLVGQKEIKRMHESAQDLAQAIPAAKGYVVAGAIHNWSMQLPELFGDVVRAWFGGRELPKELRPLQ
jgi:pimeloyl-ACP methyl ester carboxylesterase